MHSIVTSAPSFLCHLLFSFLLYVDVLICPLVSESPSSTLPVCSSSLALISFASSIKPQCA